MSNDPKNWPVYQPTTIDELMELAAFLHNHEQVSPIITRLGIHGDCTEDEEALINDIIDQFAKINFSGLRDPLLMKLSVTLCRWIADGRIVSPMDAEARSFLEDRYFDRSGGNFGINTKKAFAEEVLWVARDLQRNPIYWKAIQEAGETGAIDQDYWRTVLRPISAEIKIKYGLINRGAIDFSSVLRQIAAGNIRNLDDPAALKYIKRSNLFVRQEEQS